MIGVHYIKYVNDRGFVVKREMPVHRFEVKGSNRLNMELCQAYRDYLGCDHVLRTKTHFLFCETIEDAELDWELT
jgi:arginine decarboxylase-like protein